MHDGEPDQNLTEIKLIRNKQTRSIMQITSTDYGIWCEPYLAIFVRHRDEAVLKQLRAFIEQGFTEKPLDDRPEQLIMS